MGGWSGLGPEAPMTNFQARVKHQEGTSKSSTVGGSRGSRGSGFDFGDKPGQVIFFREAIGALDSRRRAVPWRSLDSADYGLNVSMVCLFKMPGAVQVRGDIGYVTRLRANVKDGRANAKEVVDFARVDEANELLAHNHGVKICRGE